MLPLGSFLACKCTLSGARQKALNLIRTREGMGNCPTTTSRGDRKASGEQPCHNYSCSRRITGHSAKTQISCSGGLAHKPCVETRKVAGLRGGGVLHEVLNGFLPPLVVTVWGTRGGKSRGDFRRIVRSQFKPFLLSTKKQHVLSAE